MAHRAHSPHEVRYKIPFLKDKRHRLILKQLLPPGCKRACREVIDPAFHQLKMILTGQRLLPVIRRPM